MSLQINDYRIAGNLTRDPQLRLLTGGQSVCSFGIATNRRWTDKVSGEKKEEATFVDVQVWGKTAEMVARYFVKGQGIYCSGRLRLEQWEKDGQKHAKLSLVADDVKFTTDAKRDGAAPAAASTGPIAEGTQVLDHKRTPADDEPPF